MKVKMEIGVEIDSEKRLALIIRFGEYLEKNREEIFNIGDNILTGEDLSPSEREEVILECLREATYTI